MKLKTFFVIGIGLPIIIGGLLYHFIIRDPLDGITQINGSFEDIEIYTLDHGFKQVKAKTYLGAIYGLGFNTARDRLW